MILCATAQIFLIIDPQNRKNESVSVALSIYCLIVLLYCTLYCEQAIRLWGTGVLPMGEWAICLWGTGVLPMEEWAIRLWAIGDLPMGKALPSGAGPVTV